MIGKTFSESANDWQLLYSNVASILQQKYAEGYHIAIISNQNGVSRGHTTLSELQRKLDIVLDTLGKWLCIVWCDYIIILYYEVSSCYLMLLLVILLPLVFCNM